MMRDWWDDNRKVFIALGVRGWGRRRHWAGRVRKT